MGNPRNPNKQNYQKSEFWEKTKPWLKGNYTEEGIKCWENFLKKIKKEEKIKAGPNHAGLK